MSLSKVIEIARLELGVTEQPPGSNRVKYWDIFGPEWQGQPWCVAFLAWVYDKAGERMAFFGGGRTASCSTLLRWYREQGLTVPVEQVKVGDIVILNFHGKQEPEHCGLVEKVAHGDDGRVQATFTIEGNTTPSGDEYGPEANGGCVAFKTRYPRQIVAVCRPQYQPEPVTVDDWSNHHAADAIRWGIDMGLIQGYPDGSMRPDEPMPMWRALTILKRYHERLEESK